MRKAFVAFLWSLTSFVSAAQTFSDWQVGQASDGTPFMVTVNDSGQAFGKWCDASARSCFWMFATSISCLQQAKSDALLNASAGAAAIHMVCSTPTKIGSQTMYRNLIENPDFIDGVVSQSSTFSVAIAMDGDAFRVMRFSLNGARPAFAAFQRALQQSPAVRPTGTVDKTL